jgi:hypothetical protein
MKMWRNYLVAAVESQQVVDGILHLGFDIFVVDDAAFLSIKSLQQ